jgi:predicted ABC-type ATPase
MFNDLNEIAASLDEHIEKGLALEKKAGSRVEQLKKGLSHDPFRPHEMGFESTYYNPYKYQAGEGFLPYESAHWESMGRDTSQGQYLTTDKLYREFDLRTSKIKDTTGDLFRSFEGLRKMSKALGMIDLEKAGAIPMAAKPAAKPAGGSTVGSGMGSSRGLPIGTVHTYADGQRYKKVAQGQWVPMAGLEDKGHAKWLSHFNPKTRAQANDQIESHAADHSERTKKVQDLVQQRLSSEDIKRQAIHEMANKMLEHKGHDKEFKQHLKKIAAEHSDKASKKNLLDSANKEVAKKETATKPHYVDVKFKHKGVDYSHTMKNIEAKDAKEAETKATEGMKQLQAISGHEIKSVKARESERLPKEGIYNPKESLGVKRKDMPQITEEAQKDFMAHLKEQGVGVKTGKMKISEMKPSQDEMDADKAAKLQDDPHLDKPIIVSKDDYIMDGHHRWLAARMKDEDQKANVIKVDMNGKELLDVMRKYPESFSTDIKDNPSIPFKEGDVTTAEAFKNDKGEYKMARKELHENIVRSVLDNVKSVPPPEGQKPTLILTGGGSGSGKGSIMKAMRSAEQNHLGLVDADEIKKSIPEYNKWVSEGNDKAAALAHDESSDLSMQVLRQAFKEGKPMVYDSTLKNVQKAKDIIKMAREHGFTVKLGFADCPLEVSSQRADERAKKTGRKVPKEVVEQSNKDAIAALHQIIDDVDYADVYDTTGDPPPKKVYSTDKAAGVVNRDDKKLEEMRARGHMLKSEEKAEQSDAAKKFDEVVSGMKDWDFSDSDFPDEHREDGDINKEIKYEGESDEQK